MNILESINARITAVQTNRAAAGLHVKWQLPDGSEWSAYADCEATKARWIKEKAALGWIHISE